MRALMILGPTASGKTALALDIARRVPVEIISVDSALVYRGMDIGTAKPSADELAQVPHHLIDIREPSESYSAAEFSADAWQLIGDIEARGRLPLLVGGTMLYARTLLHPMDDLPGARRWMPKPPNTAGPFCMHAWPNWTRPPHSACTPPMRSASSAHWKSSKSPASPYRRCSRPGRNQRHIRTSASSAWSHPSAAYCMHALRSVFR